jgi:hypothetical protein
LGGVPTSRTLTINGTTYDLSADRSWTISAGVSGSGTTNYVPKFTSASAIGNSQIYDSGSFIGINNTTPQAMLDVYIGSVGTYFRGGSDNVARQLKISSSTTTNAGDTHTLDAQSGTGVLAFATTSTERMRITSSGNILIGTTTDSGYKLDVTGTGRFTGNVAGNGVTIGASDVRSSSNVLTLGGTSEVIRIVGSSGNVGIGTSSPTGARLDVRENAANSIRWGSTSTQYGFTSWDTNLAIIGSIGASTSIGFWTNGNTERMRITSTGNLLIGTTTDAGYKLDVNGTVRTANLYFSTNSARIYSGAVDFAINNSSNTVNILLLNNGTFAATFASSVTATAFFESSDKRLKKELNANPIVNGISNIKPKLYIKDGKEELGYYAQDLKEVLPSAVSKNKDGFLSLSYAQVHTAKIAELETEVKELKEIVKTLINELGRNK